MSHSVHSSRLDLLLVIAYTTSAPAGIEPPHARELLETVERHQPTDERFRCVELVTLESPHGAIEPIEEVVGNPRDISLVVYVRLEIVLGPAIGQLDAHDLMHAHA